MHQFCNSSHIPSTFCSHFHSVVPPIIWSDQNALKMESWGGWGETSGFVAHLKSEMRIQFDFSVSSEGRCSSQCLFSQLLNHGIKSYVSHWSFLLVDSSIYCLLFYCGAVVTFVIIVNIFFLCILILSIAIMQYFKSLFLTQWDLINSEYL